MIPTHPQTGAYDGAGGVSIFYRHQPAAQERGRIVVVHGLGEHSGRYGHVFDQLGRIGLSAYALDLRGHGQSGGRRGHVDSFTLFLSDVAQLVDLAREGLPENGRVHLMGHSLGGLIALLFALTRPDNLAAVAASSPALGPAIKLPPIKESMGRLMSVCWPTLTLANEIDAGVLSHDPRTVAGYRSDPLVHDRVSARLYTEILAGMTRAPQMAARMALPVLIQAAGEDRLVSVPRTRDFFAALPSGDKTLLVYDGLFHEIYNEAEPDRERTLTDLTHWLETRMAAPGADRRPWDGR